MAQAANEWDFRGDCVTLALKYCDTGDRAWLNGLQEMIISDHKSLKEIWPEFYVWSNIFARVADRLEAKRKIVPAINKDTSGGRVSCSLKQLAPWYNETFSSTKAANQHASRSNRHKVDM